MAKACWAECSAAVAATDVAAANRLVVVNRTTHAVQDVTHVETVANPVVVAKLPVVAVVAGLLRDVAEADA